MSAIGGPDGEAETEPKSDIGCRAVAQEGYCERQKAAS